MLKKAMFYRNMEAAEGQYEARGRMSNISQVDEIKREPSPFIGLFPSILFYVDVFACVGSLLLNILQVFLYDQMFLYRNIFKPLSSHF